MATGFFPPDVQMDIRKSRTFVPDSMVSSSNVVPNNDGSYQLRKSLEILSTERSLYDCYVFHLTLENPIIVRDSKCGGVVESCGSTHSPWE